MRALFYLKYRSFVNSFKQLKEKPSKLISMIFYLSFLILVFMPHRGEVLDQDLQIIDIKNFSELIFSAGFLIFTSIITTITLINGTKKGINIFTKADAHILFSAPIKSASILLYGMLGQLKAAFLSSIFILYQIHNFRQLGLRNNQIIIVFSIWFLSVFALQIYSTFVYAISFDSQKKKNLITTLAYGILILIVLVYLFNYLKTKSFYDAFINFFNSKFLYMIPIVGWSKGLLDLLMLGFNPIALLTAILFFIMPVIVLLYLYRIDIDFYEDALTMVQSNPTDKKDMQEIAAETARQKMGKMKVRDLGIKRGFGESAIFFKQWREYRRTKPYFINANMIFQFVFLGIIAISLHGENIEKSLIPYVLWGINVLILYFTSFASQGIQTFNDPQFFILPGKSIHKVFYANILNILIRLIDIIPIYLLVSIVYKLNPILPLIAFIVIASLLFAIYTAQIITFRIFGDTKSTISSMLLMAISFIVLIPTGISMAFSIYNLYLSEIFKSLIFAISAIMINILIGFLGLWIGKGYLDKGPAY